MEGLKKIAIALDCATDMLVFDPNERPIADDLQRQFEAMSRLPEDERRILFSRRTVCLAQQRIV